MAADTKLHDPLAFNLHGQLRSFVSELENGSPHIRLLQNATSRAEILRVLSTLLATSGLTNLVATYFRPILLDLCARLLEVREHVIPKFEALCLLLDVHPEIYPILSTMLLWPDFLQGPLGLVPADDGASDASQLQIVLLAYYRLLIANRNLPQSFGWSLAPLSTVMWNKNAAPSVRYLAIQCYALQAGMIEGERVDLEKELVGNMEDVDCPIAYGASKTGMSDTLDGWLLHMKEATRVADARVALLNPQKYYIYEDGDSMEPIHPAELSPLIVNVHGVLMLRSAVDATANTSLISTPTTAQALRLLALHISLGVPILLTSTPSAGKSLLLSHLAATLYPHTRNQVVTIHLADTSLDPRALLGSYVSSPTRSGSFDWKEGVLVRAMREGRWVVFEDIDRGSNEVLGMIKPLTKSLSEGKYIGGRAFLEVPSRGRVEADEGFKIFATRSIAPSRNGQFPTPSFFGAHIFHEVVVESPSHADLRVIIDTRYPRLAGPAAEGLIRLWEAVRALGSTSSTRDIGLRELEKLCSRVDKLLPASYMPMEVDENTSPRSLTSTFPNPSIREDIFLEARDVFFGAGATNSTARTYFDLVASTVAEHLGLDPERRDWLLRTYVPEFTLDKDVNGSIVAVCLGRTRLIASQASTDFHPAVTRPFAMHKPAISLLSRIASAISLGEPLLLTGETGTGKTSVITHLASLLRKPLISLNLSNQTESSDLIGGFKPIDARVPASELQQQFLDLFGGTFSRKKNAHFEESVRTAVKEGKWKRTVALWLEACKLARGRIQAKMHENAVETENPRKRRKMDDLNVPESSWIEFERSVRRFEVQHVQGNGKFAFGFVEGPLVKALRAGHWILLDEVNLASPETLECVSSLLHSPTASITLTEQGSLEPVPRHPDFRLFACMNPATDVGKKDLPPNVRSRFTEIDVPPPDADKETLLSIVAQYIAHCAVGDKGVIMDVAEFYSSVRVLAEQRQLADAENHRPHFSMRTLARALTFAADLASTYSLRRALWEGCLMAFTMALDGPGAEKITVLARKHILAGVRNPKSLLAKEPSLPASRSADEFVKFGPFYLERGPFPEDAMQEYIMTPSVETKLVDLARILVTRRFPVLIEGPTSSGKTSSIEYLAKRTGHRFVRINNHEHTDIQEYLGTYVSDPATGKLVFKDGLLVRALRQGDWIVLDELNLAPTDVLEALNRLLDDNRELVIPETQEVVRPHPHFMLFATQNPPGLYAGRKVLSRAFRNRFLEVHFDDVPQAELETILCQRCRIAPSHGHRIVAVFQELQKRRQSSRIFESKHGFATLRDLFRWAGRDALDYQELADNGYMLLAERTRKDEDKVVVKEVIESVMGVKIDPTTLYDFQTSGRDLESFLGCAVPTSSQLVWTSAMQRLFVLVARALRFNEPVLLVGETGCGKTSVCQVYAEVVSKMLHSVNCHQNTETADLIGGLRPVRNKSSQQGAIVQHATALLESIGHAVDSSDPEKVLAAIDKLLKTTSDNEIASALATTRDELRKLSAMFKWQDGPLIHAMQNGDVFLMDEISLADDSVLERLNSVLESGRTIVLAERGGDDRDQLSIRAANDFKLVATMNPGGDYGKKELSPALRNRFTEVWVPPVDSRADLELIVSSMWGHESLKCCTSPLLDFVGWLSEKVADSTLVGLRDILAWVQFSNVAYRPDEEASLPLSVVFHHAANMTLLDGLGSLPQLSSYSPAALGNLRAEAATRLQELFPISSDFAEPGAVSILETTVRIGSFAIPKGPFPSNANLFSFDAPTTQDNLMRVMRACQLRKPILLEGSPGVGKTSLVAALANVCGYQLCRINLSDQTDLVDLFGSDLPVEGGGPGEFAWKDAEFLRALQEGHWVLLDEMNLAPQAVLEGLNAVLDHRGTVYIPELGRSFTRHPSFRIFAAQNPLHQGGGRKGLPKSFLNRFTKVYVQELTRDDVLLVCRNLFPSLPEITLTKMIDFTTRLNEAVTTDRSFGREGAPWEFNLRDLIRWATLLEKSRSADKHPSLYLNSLFVQRFRTPQDREVATQLFLSTFDDGVAAESPFVSVSPRFLQVGAPVLSRVGCTIGERSGRVLRSQISSLEAIAVCMAEGWLAIVTGPRRSGKASVVRLLAHLTGHQLSEISINSATDATDILGSFEELDSRGRLIQHLRRILVLLDQVHASRRGSTSTFSQEFSMSVRQLLTTWSSQLYEHVRATAADLLKNLGDARMAEDSISRELSAAVSSVATKEQPQGVFEWVDGPLVKALREGGWVCLHGANLCNPSVLDRLNSLCENDGRLVLNERGAVNGEVETIEPHPNFRLFMCVDGQYGELSRAMRNRGVEIALAPVDNTEDALRIMDHLRLPAVRADDMDTRQLSITAEALRRGNDETSGLQAAGRPPFSTLDVDSSSSALLDFLAVLGIDEPRDEKAVTYFVSHSVSPSALHLLRRVASDRHPRLDHIRALTDSLVKSRPLAETLRIREELSRELVPQEVLLVQPMDFDMSIRNLSSRRYTSGFVLSFAHLLRLHADLLLYPHHESRTLFRLDKAAELSELSAKDKATVVVERLADAIRRTARGLLDHMNLVESGAESTLALASQFIKEVHYLEDTTSQDLVDYSIVFFVSRLLDEQLAASDPAFQGLEVHANALSSLVSLDSGFGLSEVWTGLGVGRPCTDAMQELAGMADLAFGGKYELRAQIFQLFSVAMLPQSGSSQQVKAAIANLKSQVTMSNVANVSNTPVEIARPKPLLLVMQLAFMSRLNLHNRSDQMYQSAQKIIRSACEDPSSSLPSLVPYQHLLWATEADTATTAVVAAIHRQWLAAIWDISPIVNRIGPSALLLPVALLETTDVCAASDQTLLVAEAHKTALRRHLGSLVAIGRNSNARAENMLALALNGLLNILSCFHDSFDDGDWAAMHARVPIAGDPESLLVLMTALDRCRNPRLRNALRERIRSPLMSLHESAKLGVDINVHVGKLWIGYAQLVLYLFVPDAPIDPAALQDRSSRFWQAEQSVLQDQIALHHGLESRRTGRTTSGTIAFLEGLLAQVTRHLQSSTPSHLRLCDDLARLHGYWSEIHEFLDRVLSADRIGAHLSAAALGNSTAMNVEHVLQESISAICQRLEKHYADFSDISAPIIDALLAMRLGLRLATDIASPETTSEHHAQLAGALSCFPSIRSAEDVSVYRTATDSSFGLLVTKLAAIALQASLVGDSRPFVGEIKDLYDQAVGLWLVDHARDEKKAQEDQTLYRRREQEGDLDEAAEEEEEFLAMFPEFGDVLDQTGTPAGQTARQSRSLVQASISVDLLAVHHGLFGHPTRAGKDMELAHYVERRQQSLGNLIDPHLPFWPAQIDSTSLPFQVRLVCRRLAQFEGVSPSSRVYDFYHDENILEIKKAGDLLTTLLHRVDLLISRWPDQMVLHHLKSRCEAVSRLELRSPVAKVLSALEQISLNIEDWEMYADKENSLRDIQHSLTGLVVDWRRLELSAWNGLLDSQAKDFAQTASDWWFNLYNATIRGITFTSLGDAQGDENTADAFLDDLTVLLDDFVSKAPIGQFEIRLRMLQSMSRFALELYDTLDAADRSQPLLRLRHILQATWSYYSLFEQKVQKSLHDQRKTLEKDIQAFIKLASWRDINVHALRQSAQKSHRQLYKVVRKFREILRQPVIPLLQSVSFNIPAPGNLSDAKIARLGRTVAIPYPVEFPSPLTSLAYPPHLANLPTTYRTYTVLVEDRLTRSIEWNLPSKVEDLVEEIIEAAHGLAQTSIPSNLDAPRKMKLQKNLLTRKRKAWSDLLKELKRVGISANVKPQVLEQNQSPRWIREQPSVSSSTATPIVQRAEEYLNRLCGMLPILRGLLSDHHSDINTRELQRAVMHVEAGFSLALSSRVSLAETSNNVEEIARLLHRLREVSEQGIAAAGHEVTGFMIFVCEVASGLLGALQELESLLQQLDINLGLALDGDSAQEMSSFKISLEQSATSLQSLAQKVASSHPVLLNSERDSLQAVLENIQKITGALERWSSKSPDLACFIDPVLEWLRSKDTPPLPERPAAITSDAADKLIDSLLLGAQGILKVLPEGPTAAEAETDDTEDNFIRDGYRISSATSQKLNVNGVLLNLRSMFSQLPTLSESDARVSVARTLPFLERYVDLAEAQVTGHASWTKSLFKLTYVICSIVSSVAKNGFCQPGDVGEGEDEDEGGEAGEGVGIGAGSGKENISKEIQEESQVEGLQGEDGRQEDDVERAEEGNAIEMSEDIGGELQDVPQDEDETEEQSGDESDADVDEGLGELNGADENVVDEKLWGDEKSEDRDDSDKANNKPGRQESGKTEMVAKEGEQTGDKQHEKEGGAQPEGEQEQVQDESAEEGQGDEEAPGAEGAPIDDFTQDTEILDLPDNMELDGPDKKEDEQDILDDGDSMQDDDHDEQPDGDGGDAGEPEEDAMDVDQEGMQQATGDDVAEDLAEDAANDAVAQPDTHAGDGLASDDRANEGNGATADDANATQADESQAEAPSGQGGSMTGETTTRPEDEKADQETPQENVSADQSAEAQQASENPQSSSSTRGVQRGPATATPQEAPPLSANPLRSMGDALQELTKRFNEILESDGSPNKGQLPESDSTKQVEYVQEDDTVDQMQALGPARGEEEAKLRDLQMLEEQQDVDANSGPEGDSVQESDSMEVDANHAPLKAHDALDALQAGVEGALTPAEVSGSRERTAPAAANGVIGTAGPSSEEPGDDDLDVELELQQWQASGQPSDQAEHMWRRYESLTHDLSYALCEQLRLILEPTMATRLKGDYRTGKRLNMKKIIPYIASEYTKDKIWLRRTRPSQREYQVLIALDDSKSMAESHSVHLAFETLALVAKALTRLEVGDVSIVKFGESVDVLHSFDGGPFSDQAGTKIMDAFKFNQQATHVKDLLETSLTVLEHARERRATTSSSAADLWQMEIIISDGICQDHEQLRSILRKAEEQRVMVVFIILDSLRGNAAVSGKATGDNSILSMKEVAYKEVNGRMDLTVTRYLDTFPFEYYVIVRDVEALPDVLAGTLRQFFERISED